MDRLRASTKTAEPLTTSGSAYYHRGMTGSSDKERIAELETLIQKNQELYYNDEPAISDEEFDALWSELEDRDPANPLLGRIGEDKADGWPKSRHLMPMGSQSKATDPEAFESWARKVGFGSYLVQYKLDGASLELQYESGRLARAVTRGDGLIGDDITVNARRMQAVPDRLPLPFSGGVRGEVMMSRAVHAEKYRDKANCRNAANGIMKRKDGAGSEDLRVICYDALETSERPSLAEGGSLAEGKAPLFGDELEKLAWLAAMGFATVRTEIFSTWEEVVDYRGRVMALRPDMEFDIDGLVVKGLAIDAEDLAKPRPDKQIAFKFSPEEAVTRLKAIEWSESGALYTPIGIVDPVHLAGTTVQRANLCNPAMIRAMNLKIGSMVVITKRGEIIPKIETLVENPEGSVDIEQPTRCGSCGTALIDGGTRLYCPNERCPKKELHRVGKWLGILDIREFGSALIKRLHETGRVKTIVDLYSLTVEELETLERMGRTSAQKVLRNLHAIEEVSLAEFVAGFDLEDVGLLVAEKLVQGGYSTLESLFSARVEDLIKIGGIAETMATTITRGLAAVRDEMESLIDSKAIRIRSPVAATTRNSANPVAGRSFCFTGEMKAMKRPEAEKKVRDAGGRAVSSVSKELDYLVTNDPGSGSSKNRKAAEYGVAVIGEDEFLGLLEAAALNVKPSRL